MGLKKLLNHPNSSHGAKYISMKNKDKHHLKALSQRGLDTM